MALLLRCTGLGLLAASAAQAQTAGDGLALNTLGFRIQPQLSVNQTVTDNLNLSATDRRSDAITRLSAGVNLRSTSGLLRGTLDYSLSEVLYARNDGNNTQQNALTAAFGAEVIEGRARVDVGASIAQTAVSAFGVQPGAGGLPSSNLTEQRSLNISPNFRGPLGPGLRYAAGLSYAVSQARRSAAGDSSSSGVTLHLEPGSPGTIGWALDGSHSRSGFTGGRSTENDRLIGTLSRTLTDLDLRLSTNAGVELSDLATAGRSRYSNWGVGAAWTPSPRTNMAAQLDRRFFGSSRNLSFEHRTALTSWTYSDTRSLSTNGNGTDVGRRSTAFDLYFAQFASVEPDPVKRTELVNSFLRSSGLDPQAGVNTGFLRSTATVVHSQNLAVAYRALRGAAVLSVNRSATQSVDPAAPLLDGAGNAGGVRSQGLSLDLSHRLTPTASVNLTLNRQRSQGDQSGQSSGQRLMNLQYSTRLTIDSSLTLALRRALYDSLQSPFDESALTATLGLQF